MIATCYTLVRPKELQGKLVRNPNYGGEMLSNGWRGVPFQTHRLWTTKPALMAAMEESILREGYRNPIIVYELSGRLWLSFGGCRYEVGLKHDLLIPAFVVYETFDYRWYNSPEVDEENWSTFFKDPPAYFEMNENGIETHYSLEKSREGQDAQGLKWLAERADAAEIIRESFPV